MMFRNFIILLMTVCGCNCSEKKAAYDLNKFERHIYSQNGEDGIIEILFKLIGTDSRFCVEFGAVDGVICSNTLNLRKHHGWKGLLLDGGHEDIAANLHREFITAENINELFKKYQVPENLDLLSIDIDYNDFYIWKALDSDYRPRVIVIEYNAAILPHEDKVVPYKADAVWDGTNYFGAGIESFYRLGRQKGYSLVYADQSGTNLFFVRDDLLESCRVAFKHINEIGELYRPPHYPHGCGPLGGHSQDSLDRRYLSFEEATLY